MSTTEVGPAQVAGHFSGVLFSTTPTRSSSVRQKTAKLTPRVGEAASGVDSKNVSTVVFSQVTYGALAIREGCESNFFAK